MRGKGEGKEKRRGRGKGGNSKKQGKAWNRETNTEVNQDSNREGQAMKTDKQISRYRRKKISSKEQREGLRQGQTEQWMWTATEKKKKDILRFRRTGIDTK